MKDSAVSIHRDYVDGRFGQIHLRIASPDLAQGRPLLCFHLTPFSGVIYDTWLAEIGKDRLTVAVDTPGFGNSDVPSSPLSMTDYANAMPLQKRPFLVVQHQHRQGASHTAWHRDDLHAHTRTDTIQ